MITDYELITQPSHSYNKMSIKLTLFCCFCLIDIFVFVCLFLFKINKYMYLIAYFAISLVLLIKIILNYCYVQLKSTRHVT